MPEREANPSALGCYRCGNGLEELSLPFSRLDQCPACGVELHVCRMCTHYAPSAPDACDEDDAPEVRDKTAANFCDFFAPDPKARDGSGERMGEAARQKLEALFGDAPPPAGPEPAAATETALTEAEKLFRK